MTNQDNYYEKVKPSEPSTLLKIMYEKKWYNSGCDEFCDIVEKWLSQFTCETNKWDEDYKCGFMDALDTLRNNLR